MKYLFFHSINLCKYKINVEKLTAGFFKIIFNMKKSVNITVYYCN